MTELPSGTVTFLFTDIEGSSQLWEQHREAMSLALARHDALLTDAIQRHGGVVVKSRGEGDSLFSAFQRATDAVVAACGLQKTLLAEPWATPAPLRVRVAVHSGEAEQRDGDYYGPVINRCARLRAAAHGGQILLSLATQELVRDQLPGGVSLRDLGECRLKDLARTEHVFQLLHPSLPAEFPPLHTMDARPHNLPAQPTPLLGREQEVEAVRRLLLQETVRLITLTGPGGTGKTRLGLQVAAELLDDFADGVFFIPLAPINDPALVPVSIAQMLGVREAEGRPLLEALRDSLRARQLLLLLDNFEQLLPAAPLVAELLAVVPRLKVLVTSRAVLRLQGEHDYPVPPLALPDPRHLPNLELLSQYAAVELFIQRAGAARPDFVITHDNAPAVAEICCRLDGLPLAIELAAVRTRLLPPQALLERLDRRLSLLTGGARDLPARQQTLRDTIAWSYDLLTEAEKRLFRRLAVFVGGCTLEAAEAVYDEAEDLGITVLDGLASLVNQSLVKQEEQPDGEPRFFLLETIREFGLECLSASGEEKGIRQRHAQVCVGMAEHRRNEEGEPEWLARLEREHDNLRAALTWAVDQGDAELGLQLNLGFFWKVRGYVSEGRERLSHVLALPGAEEHPELRARALLSAGVLARSHGDYGAARSLLQQSLTVFRTMGLHRGVVTVLLDLGETACSNGDYEAARALLEESLGLSREHGFGCETADALSVLGAVVRRQGDYERAGAIYEESLAIYGGLSAGNWLVGRELRNLGHVANFRSDHRKAKELFRRSLSILVETRHKHVMPGSLAGMAGVAAAEGQPERGARLLGAAQALVEAMGAAWDPEELAEYDRHLAVVKAQIGEQAVTAEWTAGHAMPLDEAIACALGETTKA